VKSDILVDPAAVCEILLGLNIKMCLRADPSTSASKTMNHDLVGHKTMDSQTGGMILCGGQSLRMGQSKAWLPFGEETMLQRVVRIVGSVVSTVVVVAAPEQDLPPLPANVLVARDPTSHEGPLVGLIAGLKAARQVGIERAFVCGCDMPLIVPAVIEFLLNKLGNEAALVPEHENQLEPLAAVYRTSLCENLETLVEQGERSIQRAIRNLELPRIASKELAVFDPNLESFVSLNDPNVYKKHAL
jgi:molybdenum cofactor guanylyltransferase